MATRWTLRLCTQHPSTTRARLARRKQNSQPTSCLSTRLTDCWIRTVSRFYRIISDKQISGKMILCDINSRTQKDFRNSHFKRFIGSMRKIIPWIWIPCTWLFNELIVHGFSLQEMWTEAARVLWKMATHRMTKNTKSHHHLRSQREDTRTVRDLHQSMNIPCFIDLCGFYVCCGRSLHPTLLQLKTRENNVCLMSVLLKISDRSRKLLNLTCVSSK